MKTSKRKGSGDKGDPPKRPKTEQDENTDEPKTIKTKPNRPKKYTKADFGYFLEKLIELDREISVMKNDDNTTHKQMEEKTKERRRTWKQFQRKNIQDQAEQYYLDNPEDFRYPSPTRRRTSENSKSSKSTPKKDKKSKPKKNTKKQSRRKSTSPELSKSSEDPIYSSTDNDEPEQKETEEPEEKETQKTPPKPKMKPSRLAVPVPKPKDKPKSEEEDKPKKKKKKTKKRKRRTKSNKDKPKKPKINPLDTSVEIDDEEDRKRFEAGKKAHDIKNRISCDKKIEKLGQAGTSKQGFIPKSTDRPKTVPTFMKPQHDKDVELIKQDEFKKAVKKGKGKPKIAIQIEIVKNREELAEIGEDRLKQIGTIQTKGKELTQTDLNEIELKVTIETFVNDILDYLDKSLEEYQNMINVVYPIEPFLNDNLTVSEIPEKLEQDETSSELEILSETRPIKKEVDDWVEGQKGQKYDEADEEVTDEHNKTMTTVYTESDDEEIEEPKQDENLHNLIKTNFKHLTPVPNLGFSYDFKLVPTLQSGTKYLVTDHKTLETAKVTMAWVTDLELKLNKSESKVEVLEKEILHRKKAKNERKIVTDMERAAFQELIRSKDETIKSMQAQIDGHTCKQRGVEHFHEMRPGLTIRAITYLEECPDSDSPSTSPKRTEPKK